MKKATQQHVRILKALASVPRLEIVRLLNAIVARLGMTQPAVSEHLQLLREVGLIRAEKRGTWIHYAICPGTVDRCGGALSHAFGGWVALPEPTDGRQPKTTKREGVT